MSTASEKEPTPTQQFLDLAYVKAELNMDGDDDLDSQLLQIVQTSNRQMSLSLLPVLDVAELAGTGFWEDAKTTAFLNFRALFEKRMNRNDEDYKSYKEEYKENLTVLINAIKAQPEKATRTRLAHASASYRSRLLKNIPGMTDDNGSYLDIG